MFKDNRTSVESDLNRHHVSYEDPLWDDGKENPNRIINISMKYSKKGTEKDCEWNFFDSGKLVLTLLGQSLTKKQISYLQSPDGIKFLLAKYKEGYCNITKLKGELKKVVT